MSEIDATSLRALSIAPTLGFILITENQFLECVEKSSGQPCEIQVAAFGSLSSTYQHLLRNIASRFGFRAAENFSVPAEEQQQQQQQQPQKQCFIGAGRVPALRYADFLPGHLYVSDLLLAASAVVGTDLTVDNPLPQEERFPSTRVANARTYIVTFSPAVMKLAGAEVPALGIPVTYSSSSSSAAPLAVPAPASGNRRSSNSGGKAATSSPASSASSASVSASSSSSSSTTTTTVVDVESYSSPPLHAQLAASIDLGLPLATFSHILRLECIGNVTPSDALEAFRRFSGWRSMDVRWDDGTDSNNNSSSSNNNNSGSRKLSRNGLLVFPCASDATDVLDVYEDEDSDTDVATAVLPFKLRPLASHVVVPSADDGSLRRVRATMLPPDVPTACWHFLAASPVQLKVQISGFGVTAKLANILLSAPFDLSAATRAVLLAEVTPLRRRRVVVTFASAAAVKAALELDGHRAASLPGKPVLRVSVAAPCRDTEKRASVIEAADKPSELAEQSSGSETSTSSDGIKPAPAAAAVSAPTAPSSPTKTALLAPAANAAKKTAAPPSPAFPNGKKAPAQQAQPAAPTATTAAPTATTAASTASAAAVSTTNPASLMMPKPKSQSPPMHAHESPAPPPSEPAPPAAEAAAATPAKAEPPRDKSPAKLSAAAAPFTPTQKPAVGPPMAGGAGVLRSPIHIPVNPPPPTYTTAVTIGLALSPALPPPPPPPPPYAVGVALPSPIISSSTLNAAAPEFHLVSSSAAHLGPPPYAANLNE